MKDKIGNELRKLNVIDDAYLKQYILFCEENNLKSKDHNVSLHHILPIKIFPEYGDLNINKWNGSFLTYENHYIAHALLALSINHPSVIGAWWGMNNKDKKNKGILGIKIIGPQEYSELFERAQIESSKRMKNKVVCRLKIEPNKSIIVDIDEFRNNRHLYLANTEGKLSVIDKETSERIFIDKEDYDKNKHHFHKAGISVTKESIEKQKITMNKIQDNGLTKTQESVIKRRNTIKNMTEEEYSNFCSSYDNKGENNPNYGRVSMTNDNGQSSIRVKKEDIEEYIKKGYTLGGKKFKISVPSHKKINKDFKISPKEKQFIKIITRLSGVEFNTTIMRRSNLSVIDFIYEKLTSNFYKFRLSRIYINDVYRGLITYSYIKNRGMKAIVNCSKDKPYLSSYRSISASKVNQEIIKRFGNSYIEPIIKDDLIELFDRIK